MSPVAESPVRSTADGENLVALVDAGLRCFLCGNVDAIGRDFHGEEGHLARFVAQDIVEIGDLVGDGAREQKCEHQMTEDGTFDGHSRIGPSASAGREECLYTPISNYHDFA